MCVQGVRFLRQQKHHSVPPPHHNVFLRVLGEGRHTTLPPLNGPGEADQNKSQQEHTNLYYTF